MKFCWTTITVNDMDESLNFYKDVVGLNLNHRFGAGPGIDIAFLGNGETKIELICYKDKEKSQIGQDISVGFAVESLDEKLASLKEMGIPIHSGPFQPNPGTRFFFVQDPNGLKVQFVESES